ncbi:hypothetical protein [Nocardioides pacificus]
MNWLSANWLDILGWSGSALLVLSLLQARVLRFRILNLIACLTLIVFNGLLEIWPMAAMNVVLSVINIWFIYKLTSDRHDEAAYAVLEVGPGDEYLRHVLRVHGSDILKNEPDFVWDHSAPDQFAYLVQKGDETVGVVLLRGEGDRAHVVLDYVTPRYRDFSPGEFVWRPSGGLRSRGYHQVVTNPNMTDPYYDKLKVGFRPEGDSFVLDL